MVLRIGMTLKNNMCNLSAEME